MTSPSFPVALGQMNSGADKAVNIESALSLIDAAAATGARLVVLPEVWTYLGPDDGTAAAAEPIPGPLTDVLSERAVRHGMFIHAGSILEVVAGEPKVFNTSVVLDPQGEIIATYRKIHLFDVDLEADTSYRESATVGAGDEIVTFDLDGVTVGLAICYDLRFPELFRILALRGAQAIVLPAAFAMATGRDHWETLIRARAIENGLYMLAPGQWGVHPPGLWCYGRSMIVDPWGTVVTKASDVTGLVQGMVDIALVDRVRVQVPSLANRRPGQYRWPDEAAIPH
ncbi:MAG: carbon-nitrogen hydrolase family protein [Thermomicrobiales bacterium]